jgi:phosphate transport system permease protein
MANFNNIRGSKSVWREGEHFVWLTGAALAITILLTITLIGVVMANGLGTFWPSRLTLFALDDGTKTLGIVTQENTEADGVHYQLKIANRDLYGLDFTWIEGARVKETTYPEDAIVLERSSYGNFQGFLISVADGRTPTTEADTWARFVQAKQSVHSREKELLSLEAVLAQPSEQNVSTGDLEKQRDVLTAELSQTTATFVDALGTEKIIPLTEIVRYYRPNAMSIPSKLGFYGSKLVELLFAQPRESNTEGGLFPAIFGTIALIFLMSILSFPLGLLAGIYLREYATDGFMVRAVRIAVNNLAGIPSIVYGIFGLGFFVYGVGGTIDRMFFADQLPNSTFGTGGILWSSLTLGLLTVPVVIVATEEALGAIPRGIREGSLALGATKFQTLVRILVPMASPGIMTGFILAMARAAGEVAPLMITGVVKSAPSLPIDGSWPFLHLDRKFMHLGFHIFDMGFQSPNVEAAKPMVFVTTLLLVLIVLCMSSIAIHLRNKMKKRYTLGAL